MRSDRGFTLMELVLAISLFALMAALSFPVIRSLQKHSIQTRQQAIAMEAERAAWQWLRQTISRAEPLALAVDPASGRDVLWQADASELRWMGKLPAGMPQTRAVLQSLRIEQTPTGQTLWYRLTDNGNQTDTRLFNAQAQVQLSYRGIAAGGRLGEWQSQWPDATQMPVQVRIQLVSKTQITREQIIALPLSSALQGNRFDVGIGP